MLGETLAALAESSVLSTLVGLGSLGRDRVGLGCIQTAETIRIIGVALGVHRGRYVCVEIRKRSDWR